MSQKMGDLHQVQVQKVFLQKNSTKLNSFKVVLQGGVVLSLKAGKILLNLEIILLFFVAEIDISGSKNDKKK